MSNRRAKHRGRAQRSKRARQHLKEARFAGLSRRTAHPSHYTDKKHWFRWPWVEQGREIDVDQILSRYRRCEFRPGDHLRLRNGITLRFRSSYVDECNRCWLITTDEAGQRKDIYMSEVRERKSDAGV